MHPAHCGDTKFFRAPILSIYLAFHCTKICWDKVTPIQFCQGCDKLIKMDGHVDDLTHNIFIKWMDQNSLVRCSVVCLFLSSFQRFNIFKFFVNFWKEKNKKLGDRWLAKAETSVVWSHGKISCVWDRQLQNKDVWARLGVAAAAESQCPVKCGSREVIQPIEEFYLDQILSTTTIY